MGTTCGIKWPVCPHDLGQALTTTAGRSFCPLCGRSWLEADRTPCPDAATVVLADQDTTGLVCRSHAQHPAARDLRAVFPPQEDTPHA